jgi:ATP-binding cassette subfamily C (CFTR/MRP) protein 1
MFLTCLYPPHAYIGSRISIARAVYGDQPIVLLDDPLSAVDAHVGQHIFDEVLLGALADRTRIMCTNQLQYLPHADLVVVVKEGKIVEKGSYEVVCSYRQQTFSNLSSLIYVIH